MLKYRPLVKPSWKDGVSDPLFSMTSTVESLNLVLDARARLGECPVWDARSQTLYWIDIYGHRVHRLHPETGASSFFDLAEVAGPIAMAGSQRLIMGQRSHLVFLDTQTGKIEVICELEADLPHNRFNDGKCDTRGRFWFGSMSELQEPTASLYRYDPDGSLQVMETGLTISNGLGWSPDDRVFYLTDSPRQKIYAYDYDAETGAIGNRRVWVDLGGEWFYPDGLAIDTQGCIWSAMWNGWCIIRFDPDGREIERIPIPVQFPTSCTFGGPQLQDLYITTASVGMSQKEIQKSFYAGGVFCQNTTAIGLPDRTFSRHR